MEEVRTSTMCFGSNERPYWKALTAPAVLFIACILLSPALAQTNNAQYISDTIPAVMTPGFSYSVSITMKNTGTSTWTKALNYRLGAVGDSDPFAPGRIDLADSDSIAPGQQKTVSFTMNAGAAGVYTSDWRMLRESVEWFGDTLTKQVNVTFGPNPPGAPTITSPTGGMILGSNRPDIMLQGDPFDSYEIHIGSYNTPNSSNGWDSGQVWVSPAASASVASGPLPTQATYYVFVRLHNTNGWGAWSGYGNWFYVAGELPNDPYYVAGPDGGQWQHTICYNPDRNEYLVAYMDAKTGQKSVISYYRLDGTGTKIGGEMSVVDNLEGAGGPQIAYNNARHEYLISYGGYTSSGGLHDELRVQRIDSSTGSLIGGSNWIANQPGAFINDVAYSPTSNCYLVAWDGSWDTPSPVHAQRLDTTGVPVGSVFHVSNGTYIWAGNPVICYNSVNNEFLVTFQWYGDFTPQTWWDNFARRVRPSDGALLGTQISISATLNDDAGTHAAYDSDMNRYLIVYAGGDPTPWGQFMSATGALMGTRFQIAGPYYNGGMVSVAWNSIAKEYLVTWAHGQSESNFGRRISQTGDYLGEPFRTNGNVMGYGNWDPTPVFNSVNNEFLIEWFWQYDNVYVRRYRPLPLPTPDTTPPGPVTNFTATPSRGRNILTWMTPSDSDFSGTMIRYRTDHSPAGVTDGTLLCSQGAVPGAADSFTHTNLSAAYTYYYAAFAYDEALNYAPKATDSARPTDAALNVKPAGSIVIDGSPSDWNLPEFTTKIRGGQSGSGDVALVGYDGATLYYGGYNNGYSLPTSASDFTAKVYSVHDLTYQYFLVRCDDDDVRYNYGQSENWRNDCVEFYIDPSHDHGSIPMADSTSDVQLVIDANNQKNVYMATPSYTAQVLAGVSSAVARDGSGWWLELRIQKNVLSPSLPLLGSFGVDFSFRDNDSNNNLSLTSICGWSDPEISGAFPTKIPNSWGNTSLADPRIGPVTNFTVTSGNQQNGLTWTNPTDPDFTGTRILFRTDNYPSGANDPAATPIYDDAGTGFLHSALTNGQIYYYSAFAHDAASNYSTGANAYGTPVAVPAPGPVTSFKTYGGNQRVDLAWINPTDPSPTGIRILCKSGSGYPMSPTDPSATIVYDSLGTSCSHTGLNNGTRYYFAAYAYTGPESFSGPAQSSTYAAAEVSIPTMKGLANSVIRSVKGNVVTAVFSANFYIQDPVYPYGLKVSTTETPLPSVGQKIDVVGSMTGMAGVERSLSCTGNWIRVTDPGPITITPAALNNKAVGGVNLNDKTPGVAGGTGANNVGLLVRVSGKVTQTQAAQYFYVDDGCGLKDGTKTSTIDNVGVRIKVSSIPSGVVAGKYVVVTGIVSPFSSSGLRPQILPSASGGPAGIQIVGP